MYRLRTADRGKPLIISDALIRDYSDGHVDTLHKKNLLSLGEDRYLTTLMTKHFPFMSYKFVPDAYCQTAAPEKWSVLLSQRRRWINSTIHNLVELMRLKEMCGFCCFSMRFVVFIDLFGTLILPATCAYLGFLIYTVATHSGQFPIISIAMLAAVYGLQALVFILKRQWQHVGWMIIYILAFPFYSFVLPVYSFWNQDNFTWGNTRIVIGEKGNKKVIATDNESFDPRSIPLQRWDDYALTNNLPGRRGGEKGGDDAAAAMSDIYGAQDDIKSVYSSVRQPSVLTGFPGRGNAWMPPQSPAPFAGGPGQMSRNSTFGAASPYTDAPVMHRQSMVYMGGASRMQPTPAYPDPQGMIPLRNMSNTSPALGISPSPNGTGSGRNTPRASVMMQYAAPMPALPHMPSMGGLSYNAGAAARQSTASFDYQRGNTGPDDVAITEAIQGVLREVDLDTVTKKQVRALVEQRLQTELVGERRTFLDRQIDHELASM
jgi:chitin synthase